MSSIIMTVAVEDLAVEPLGVKEAAVMLLEPLGGVRVLTMEVREPEQLRLDGAAPFRSAAPPERKGSASKGQAPAPSRPKPYVPKGRPCCLSCANFRPAWKGYGEPGQLSYGKCQHTNEPVHSLSGRCGAWKEAQ